MLVDPYTATHAENVSGLCARKKRQNAMTDGSAISGKPTTPRDVYSEPSLPFMIALDIDDLVSIQDAYASGFADRTDEGAQLRLRDCPEIHSRNGVEAEFERLQRQTVLLRFRKSLQI